MAARHFVDFDLGVNTAVKKLRQALEDSAEHPRFIETLPKLGYRFMVPVEWQIGSDGTGPLTVDEPIALPSSEPMGSPPTQPKGWWRVKKGGRPCGGCRSPAGTARF